MNDDSDSAGGGRTRYALPWPVRLLMPLLALGIGLAFLLIRDGSMDHRGEILVSAVIFLLLYVAVDLLVHRHVNRRAMREA